MQLYRCWQLSAIDIPSCLETLIRPVYHLIVCSISSCRSDDRVIDENLQGTQASGPPPALTQQLMSAAQGLESQRMQIRQNLLRPSHNLPTRTLQQQVLILMSHTARHWWRAHRLVTVPDR